MFDVKKIREDFPILKRKIKGKKLVYLDSAATSQKPIQVIDAITDYYKNHNANVHRGIHALSEESTEMVENARSKIADFIGANSEKEVIFVRNATEGVNLVMRGWGDKFFKKGDVVLTTEQEHHSNLVPWQVLTSNKEGVLGVVEVNRAGILELEGNKVKGTGDNFKLGGLSSLLDEKVKLVVLTQVSNLLGVINPMKEIVKLIRKKSPGAKILVDGSQSVPHMEVNMKEMGIDFFVFSGHKMLGPTGVGVLWAKEEILKEMEPVFYGGDMISDVKLLASRWNSLPYKFEAGTPNMAGMVGLGAAVEYLERLGMNKVREHEEQLVEYGLKKLGNLENKGMVEIYGPKNSEIKGGVLTFNVKGVHAHDTAQVLDGFGIAVRSGFHCAQPLAEKLSMGASVRASFYIYNTKEEIDFLMEKIPEVLKVFKIKSK
jgi:cysteine desulfurase / selenocysteine lyase